MAEIEPVELDDLVENEEFKARSEAVSAARAEIEAVSASDVVRDVAEEKIEEQVDKIEDERASQVDISLDYSDIGREFKSQFGEGETQEIMKKALELIREKFGEWKEENKTPDGKYKHPSINEVTAIMDDIVLELNLKFENVGEGTIDNITNLARSGLDILADSPKVEDISETNPSLWQKFLDLFRGDDPAKEPEDVNVDMQELRDLIDELKADNERRGGNEESLKRMLGKGLIKLFLGILGAGALLGSAYLLIMEIFKEYFDGCYLRTKKGDSHIQDGCDSFYKNHQSYCLCPTSDRGLDGLENPDLPDACRQAYNNGHRDIYAYPPCNNRNISTGIPSGANPKPTCYSQHPSCDKDRTERIYAYKHYTFADALVEIGEDAAKLLSGVWDKIWAWLKWVLIGLGIVGAIVLIVWAIKTFAPHRDKSRVIIIKK